MPFKPESMADVIEGGSALEPPPRRRHRYTDPDALFDALCEGDIDEDEYAEQLSEILWGPPDDEEE